MRKISIILSGIFLHCSLQAQTTFQYYYHNYYSLSHVVGCTVVPINNEGYAISGFLLIPVGTWRAYIMKLDLSGSVIWTSMTDFNVAFNNGNSYAGHFPKNLIHTNDGGFAMIVSMITTPTFDFDLCVVKLD